MISHIWFDVEETLTRPSPEFLKAHDDLTYSTYASLVKKPISDALKVEFKALHARQGSISAVFHSLGCSWSYWQDIFSKMDKSPFYKPDSTVTKTLEALKTKVPISIFTNLKRGDTQNTLRLVGLPLEWFKHILSGEDVKERKPALEGFHKLVALSGVPAHQLLFVGDSVKKDILPSKAIGMRTAIVWSSSEEANYSCPHFKELLLIEDFE